MGWHERHHAEHAERWARRRQGALFRMGPAAFVRARLHRRIFLWFGMSILFTGLVLFTLSRLVSSVTGSGYQRELERARAFTAWQFEQVWDRPAERAALAGAVSRELEVRVELRDAAGAAIEPFSEPCERAVIKVDVTRGGAHAGNVGLCFDERRPTTPWGGIVLSVVFAVMWAASGRIARRLARPLGELARVAQDLGRGKLDSRVDLGCYEHGEVGVVAEAMNDMAARIQKQLADQRELLASVSHELRTPLSRIRLLTEIARDGGEPGHAFDEIDREVIEIDQLVGDLLASSRIEFSALSTKEVAADEAARRAIARAGLDVEAIFAALPPGSAPRLAADPTLLARALANLIDNARRHGGGVARVLVRASGERVAFEVEDDGPGLAPGEEERIFEPFYQGNAGPEGAPKKGALGLGLSLVGRIAEAHGGRAYAENRAEGGARVVLELPLRQPPPEPSPLD